MHLIFAVALLPALGAFGQTKTLDSKWTSQVNAANVHREYPRPQMVRENWQNLNGEWELELRGEKHTILVPFPVESKLSGVQKRVEPEDTLHYSRSFTAPSGDRMLLHIGASDWDTRVVVNGIEVGRHQGGFSPFTFDITEVLKGRAEHRLEVFVQDPTSSGPQPRGKQHLQPRGIMYTPSSGIWQTVWLEPVPKRYIADLVITADADSGEIEVGAEIMGDAGSSHLRVKVDGQTVAGAHPTAKIENMELWSPDSPRLYDVEVELVDDSGKVLDRVKSYTAFRKIELKPASDGHVRFFLNGKETFLMGTLDQGFWSDGLFTPPTDEALKFDIELQKRLGYNFIRKHVKIEPARWYYWCDVLGMLVMQDMPSGEKSIGPNDPDIVRTPESAEIFRREYTEMIDSLRNHPSIFSWVVFNEGWGQFDTADNTEMARQLDPTRLINAVTGWADRGVGDFYDIHVYPGPGIPVKKDSRALFLGEFGGLGLVIPDHTWQESGWGYQSYESKEQLTDAFVNSMFQLNMLRSRGLMGAVYTQTTDVETELNGLMTYDRRLLKMDETRITAAIRSLYGPKPTVRTLVPTSEEAAQHWTYTFTNPGEGWITAESWPDEETGPGGFGTEGTPGAVVRTEWNTSEIWIRRSFALESDAENVYLRIHHDEDAEVYLDGKLIAKLERYQTGYSLFRIGEIKAGSHELRISCRQTTGGQYIDAGFVTVE